MVAESDEGAAGLVLGEDFFEFREGGGFRAGGREVRRRGGRQARGKGGLNEVLEGFQAEEGEHLLLVFVGGTEMAGEKGEILGDRGGGSGLRGRRGLFRRGSSGNRHFCENKGGQGLGKG